MKTIMPIDSGKTLITTCQSVSVTDLLHTFKEEYKEIFLQSKISTLGIDLEFEKTKPKYGGDRIWFKCPSCKKRVEKVYKHSANKSLGCRSCLNLDYASRMYKGMPEDL